MNKIVLRKISDSLVPSELYATVRFDCLKRKLFYFNLKMVQKSNLQCRDKERNYFSYKGNKNYNNFKKFWFCNNCYSVYDLKASRKYKTLQRYNLKCPECNSCNISHNHILTKAIIDKKSVFDLVKHAEKEGVNIIIDDTNKLKYVPVLILSGKKSESIEHKISFNIN